MPPASPPPLLCVALFTLREARGWTAKDLAEAAGVTPKTIWTWENVKPPPREQLEEVLALMDYEPEAIDALLLGLRLALGPPEEPLSPVDPSGDLLRRIRRLAARLALTNMELIERHLVKLVRSFRTRRARRKATRLWARLKGHTAKERRLLVEKAREFQTWSLAELLCDKSAEAASHRADLALELAALACRAAELAPGGEVWRSRLRGYALAFLANALRVSNKLQEADASFARALALWEAGAAADPGLLAEWRLPDLEASLHRDQRRFAQALARLESALALAPREEKGRILLKKAATFEQMGEAERAVETLQEAAPLIDGKREPHRLFALRFNWASALCDLERFGDAEALLPEVRQRALALRNHLDMLRTVWLAARVDAGLGRTAEAEASFEQVRRAFRTREMDYDYALVSLELAVLLLGQGRGAEVRALAEEMARIFARQKIHREALAALSLFCEAAREELATADLARRLIAYLHRARNDPALRFEA
jgi:transcriptional regulator with XRE-family HTH domain